MRDILGLANNLLVVGIMEDQNLKVEFDKSIFIFKDLRRRMRVIIICKRVSGNKLYKFDAKSLTYAMLDEIYSNLYL